MSDTQVTWLTQDAYDRLKHELDDMIENRPVIAAKIRIDIPAADISDVMDDVASLLDYSIATQGYVIKASETTNYIDLSQIDFDTLRAKFDKGRKRSENCPSACWYFA